MHIDIKSLFYISKNKRKIKNKLSRFDMKIYEKNQKEMKTNRKSLSLP